MHGLSASFVSAAATEVQGELLRLLARLRVGDHLPYRHPAVVAGARPGQASPGAVPCYPDVAADEDRGLATAALRLEGNGVVEAGAGTALDLYGGWLRWWCARLVHVNSSDLLAGSRGASTFRGAISLSTAVLSHI